MISQEPDPIEATTRAAGNARVREPAGLSNGERIGLLGSILANPSLRRQLGGMAADEKTIALLSDDGNDFSHPDWKVGDSNSAELETLEFSIGDEPVDELPADVGFVPRRRITSVGADATGEIDYRIVGKLGAGGTGVVFQAHQRAVDREVAVKMLRDELAFKRSSRERFLAEARVIGGLDHPNVIALHEVYADEKGSLFYSMKRIDGTSWDKQIGDYTVSQNVETLLRIADAIRYAHSRGLIHRDIKPENVMLGRFGEVLLADWGLAINREVGEGSAAAHVSIGGTPAYMAPELATASAGAITFQTDVYLLGAILFQILTGRPPHHGKTLLECIHAAAHNVIFESDVEGELMDIALTAMATRPIDRFKDVESFIDAIKGQRQHEQSVRLARRAVAQVASATSPEPSSKTTTASDPYQAYGIADALLAEAIETWPGNEKAHQTRKRLQLEFADIAAQRGDFDLAMNIYEAAGESESESAAMVQLKRRRRDASQQQVSRYSALFTNSPDAGLLVQMKSGEIVEANQAFAKLFGYTAEQVVGKSIGELALWVCPQRRTVLVECVQQAGSVDEFEAQFFHTDGRIIDVVIAARVVEVQNEQMLVSTMRDISLRKIAENNLKRSRARLRDLQRMAGLATWSFDVPSGQVSWSAEAFQLAGRSRDDGTPTREEYFKMIHPDDRENVQKALDLAVQSGAAYELSVRQLGTGGVYRNVMIRGQPIFDDAGKTIEVYGIVMAKP